MAHYEKEQARLQQLWDKIDMSDDDPYENESGNDPEYQVDDGSASSSDIPTKRHRKAKEVVVTASETESEDEVADNQSMSSKEEWDVVVGNFRGINFSEDVGLTQEVLDMRKNEDVLAYFQLFVDDQVIDLMVEQTNLYAEQVIVNSICDESIGPSSRLAKWRDIDKNELYCFLGCLLWMGLDKKPKLLDYWRTSELYWSSAAKYMSRNRSEILLRLWHFADNELCPPGDRLQALVDLLNEKFKRIIYPGENLCIDETMVIFRGRLKFRQYIKGKRHKFGIKLFKLCLPGGFTYNVKTYCGSEKIDGMSVATKVVLELMGDCLGKGATLFTDNWYTSIELAENLVARDTHLVDTLRRNRKELPKEVVSAKLKKGEIIAREKNGIVVLKWKDKRDVLMLTTKHDDSMTEIPGRVGNRAKPQAKVDYNKAKGFIDISDQLSSYSTSVRRSLKWFRKVAVELLTGASIVNAQYLYNKNNPTKPLSIIEYRERVCLKLLVMNKKEEQPAKAGSSTREHKFVQADKKGRCVLCYQKNKDTHGREYAIRKTKQVTSKCQVCAQNFICLECFFANHTIGVKKN